jgi:hypothetical protein
MALLAMATLPSSTTKGKLIPMVTLTIVNQWQTNTKASVVVWADFKIPQCPRKDDLKCQ